MASLDLGRFGPEGLLPGAGSVPRPAGLLGPGPSRNPAPVLGVGVGSASEEASGRGRCCGADFASSSAGSAQPAPLLTGSEFEGAEPSRGDVLADPLAPAPGAPSPEPARAPPPPARAFFPAPRPSPFAVPPGRGCEDAPCEEVRYPRDWLVRFEANGLAWPAFRRRRPDDD